MSFGVHSAGMRNAFIVLAALAAAVMVFLYLQPVCPGGTIVRDEEACQAAAGFDVVFCREAFARAPGIARVSGPSYPRRGDCDNAWPLCVDHAGGWGPQPSSWCLARTGSGFATRVEPQYDNRRG